MAYLNVDFSAEFAFAFAISRLVRRFRLPVEIAVAKGMKTMAPVLATVRILDLFSKLTPGKEKTSTCESETRDQSKMSFLEKGSNYVYDTVNQYGLCYFLSSRLVGVVVVFGIYESILLGVDMSPLIEYFGAEKVGDVLGTWAGAVVIAGTLYPATFLLLVTLHRISGRNERKFLLRQTISRTRYTPHHILYRHDALSKCKFDIYCFFP